MKPIIRIEEEIKKKNEAGKTLAIESKMKDPVLSAQINSLRNDLVEKEDAILNTEKQVKRL